MTEAEKKRTQGQPEMGLRDRCEEEGTIECEAWEKSGRMVETGEMWI